MELKRKQLNHFRQEYGLLVIFLHSAAASLFSPSSCKLSDSIQFKNCHLGQIYFVCYITANSTVATSSCGMLWPSRQAVVTDISRAQTVL